MNNTEVEKRIEGTDDPRSANVTDGRLDPSSLLREARSALGVVIKDPKSPKKKRANLVVL